MKIHNLFQNIPDVDLFENVDIGQYTTLKLKLNGNLLLIRNSRQLPKVLGIIKENKINYHLIGLGANQIIKTSNCLFIKLKFEFDETYMSSLRTSYILPASLPLNILVTHAMKFDLKGWDALTGIPATLGGAVYMNAGTNLGEISSIVDWVEIFTKENYFKIVKIEQDSFSYRKNHFVNDGDIITTVCIKNIGTENNLKTKIREYLELRNKTQPLWTQNCGCVFKNYSNELRAGKCIDELGLKGYQIGNVRVSPVHANFFENLGNATPEEYLELMYFVQNKLKEKYGILFEFEAKIY